MEFVACIKFWDVSLSSHGLFFLMFFFEKSEKFLFFGGGSSWYKNLDL